MSAQKGRARQRAQVAHRPLELPEGVTALDWALERVQHQNPRIRAFLGCIRLVEEVRESNYALLHCSPDQLLEVWLKVRQVSKLVRNRIDPLLQAPSRISALETARRHAATALKRLDEAVLRKLDQFPDEVSPGQLHEVRKLLCTATRQIRSFLLDAFGELMSKDPRSLQDVDYFLSRRFCRDVEEGEWLHSTVLELKAYLEELEQVRPLQLTAQTERMRREKSLPARTVWEETSVFLQLLLDDLTPKLKGAVTLRGVRFYEMEILDRYTQEIPVLSQALVELYETGQGAIRALTAQAQGACAAGREQSVRDIAACQTVFSRRMTDLLSELDHRLRELLAFVLVWLEGIERRRALLLRGSAQELPPPASADH